MGAETAENKVDTKTDSSSLKNDIERIGKAENGISSDEFLEKYEDKLKTDIKAFTEVISNFDDMTETLSKLDDVKFIYFTNRIIDIGMHYLGKDKDNVFALKIIDSIYKPIIRLSEEKDIIFNEKTGEEKIAESPSLAIESLNELFGAAENKIKKPNKSPAELDDNSFLDISDKIDSMLDLSKEYSLRILLSSKEKPFENIAIFKKIVKTVIEKYPTHQSNDLIRLVLRRGAKMMKEDEQTKKEIYKLLEDSEYGKIQKDIKDTLIEADKFMKEGKYEESLEKIICVLKLDGTNPEASALFSICTETIVNKGFLLMRDGKYSKAMENFCLVLKYLPNDTRTISFAAKCQNKILNNRYKNDWVPSPGEKAPQLSEAESEDLINKGAELLSKEKFKEARIIFLNLNEFNPGNPMVIQALSICSEGLASQEAVEASKKLEEITVTNSKKWKEKVVIISLGKEVTVYRETPEGKLKMKREIIREVLPHITNQIAYAKEAISYKRQLLKNDVGKELTSEEEIHAYGWESFMLADSKVNKYIEEKDVDKIGRRIDSIYGNEEFIALSDFNRETADMISNIYPERKSSIWDLYKVHFDEDRADILENKDDLPVRRNGNDRYMSGIEKQNPSEDFEYVIERTKSMKLKKAAGNVIEMLDLIKKSDTYSSAPYKFLSEFKPDKILFEFKKEAAKVILEGNGSDDFNKVVESCISFCNNRNALFEIAKNAPDEKESKKAKGNLPESETGKDYIDPETELIANTIALDRYIEAIRLNPKEKKNYAAFFEFLRKIDFTKSRKIKPESADTVEDEYKALTDFLNNINLNWDKFNGNYEEVYKQFSEKLGKAIKALIQREISPAIRESGYVVTERILGLIPIKFQPYFQITENPEYARKKEAPEKTEGERDLHLFATFQRPYLNWIDPSNRPLIPGEIVHPTGGEEALLGGPSGYVDTGGIMVSLSTSPEELLGFILTKLGAIE